ncbi:MAG: hypothetical protein GF418_00525 [Chitinivibrionales bacterium]|nr:hypothetical protein [Chitinivibrionales bacterium]MBD3394085.1 hypothetical protein [Chitinivibrionales bacterium]
MKSPGALFDAVFVARPVLWIPVWGFSALGYWRALCADTVRLNAAWGFDRAGEFGWMFVFSLSFGAVCAVNQIADRNVDKINTGFPLLAKGRVGKRAAIVSALVLAGASIGIPLAGHPVVALFSAASLLAGAVYSLPPAYFTGRPFADFLSNAVGYGGIAFGAGWVLAGGSVVDPAFVRASLPYMLLMAGGSICSTLPDYEGDKAGGKRTTVVVLGPSAAYALALALLLAGTAAGAATGDWVAVAAGAGALPVWVLYAMRRTRALMEATYKVTGAFLMLIVAVLYPVIVPFSLCVLAATWLYFRLRHGVVYPSLVPAAHEG